jgi:orotate phosphoribosyltransferase
MGGSFSDLNVLVVDDSVFTGKQLLSVKAKIEAASVDANVRYASVYVIPGAEEKVDFYCESLPRPRCFEWNIMHHEIMNRSCVNLEGVLLPEPPDNGKMTVSKYETFLQSATPRMIPTETIRWLFSCKPEKFRASTEEWLNNYTIPYQELLMLDCEAQTIESTGKVSPRPKANFYLKTGADLFVDYSHEQAAMVAEYTGKLVSVPAQER